MIIFSEKWSKYLISKSKLNDAFKLFDISQTLYEKKSAPDHCYLLGQLLYSYVFDKFTLKPNYNENIINLNRLENVREAWELGLIFHSICWQDPKCFCLMANLNAALVDRWHFPMINDESRNRSYKNAIENKLNKNITIKSILDIGSGTGLLR